MSFRLLDGPEVDLLTGAKRPGGRCPSFSHNLMQTIRHLLGDVIERSLCDRLPLVPEVRRDVFHRQFFMIDPLDHPGGGP